MNDKYIFKGTPGPWAFEKADGFFDIIQQEGPIPYIARSYGGLPEEEESANVHLIAAAPDLLEAAQSALIFLGHEEGSYECNALNAKEAAMRLEAAINKALNLQ